MSLCGVPTLDLHSIKNFHSLVINIYFAWRVLDGNLLGKQSSPRRCGEKIGVFFFVAGNVEEKSKKERIKMAKSAHKFQLNFTGITYIVSRKALFYATTYFFSIILTWLENLCTNIEKLSW